MWLLGALGLLPRVKPLDRRARVTSGAISTARSGRWPSRSRCSGCCGRRCPNTRPAMRSSWRSSSASSPSVGYMARLGLLPRTRPIVPGEWRSVGLTGLNAPIDALTSPTLKHLRERWWDDEFTEFLAETLRPRPGNRILDVGCGEGLAEVSIGRLQISQVRLVGIDLVPREGGRRRVARRPRTTSGRRSRPATRCQLPFRDGAFDSTFCVAVLQHIGDVGAAVAEFARVTRPGGRVVAVEPDNAARYCLQLAPAGRARVRHGAAVLRGARRGARRAHRPGGRPASCRRCSPRTASSRSTCACSRCRTRSSGAARPATSGRTAAGAVEQRARPDARDARVRDATATSYLERCAPYEAEAPRRGAAFVEIQNTMLFATVGQRRDARCKVKVKATERHERSSVRSRRPRSGAGRRARKVTKAGTTTRRSTTGRTRGRSAGATCRSGATWRCRPAARCSSSDAAPAASRCRSAAPACRCVGIDRSAPMLDRARQRGAPRHACADRVRLRARRHPPPAVPVSSPRANGGRGQLRDGHGAVRHPAVAAARARSRGDAGGRPSRAASRAARSASSWWPTCRRGRSTGSGSA